MKNKRILKLAALLILVLSACNPQASPEPTVIHGNIETFVAQTLTANDLANQTPSPAEVTQPAPGQGETSSPADPNAPTALAPEAVIPVELVYWAPQTTDAAIVADTDAELQEYANSHGLRYQQVQNLSAPQLATSVKVVVSSAPAAQTQEMASNAAQAQFLSLVPLQGSAPNLHYAAAATQGTSAQKAFMAGYTLALITDDYRVGVLYQADSLEGQTVLESFTTGAQFYCGLCNSRFPPVTFYPKAASMSSAANYQAAVDELLVDQFVKSIYIQPEISSPELVEALIAKGVTLIGAEGQPGLSASPNWAAVLASETEPSLTPILDSLFNDRQPPAAGTGLNLTQVNPDLLTPGKLRFIETTRLELLEGKILPLPYKN